MKCNRPGNFLSAIHGITLSVTALLAATHVHGQVNLPQLAMLPPYCKYTQLYRDKIPGGNDKEKIAEWYAIMGGRYPNEGAFHHMHHYCNALSLLNSAKFARRGETSKESMLTNAISEIDYLLRSTTQEFRLLPEILTRKGEALVGLNRGPLAIQEFNRAIELKPDYWPPYAALSDYYKATGDLKLARETLERGLTESPDANALKRRLTELDTAKPKPKVSSEPSKKPAISK